jgi:hypothetical protein
MMGEVCRLSRGTAMARKVGFVARSEGAGPAGHRSGRRWFVNTAEDLCTEYMVEAAEVLCDPATLSEEAVVTFELAPNGFSAGFGKECRGTLSPDQPKKASGHLPAQLKA